LAAAWANQAALTSVTPGAHSANLLGDLGDLPSPKDAAAAVLLIDRAIGASYAIPGGHRLWIRAGGVCELASEYGPKTWNLPCVSAVVPTLVIVRSWIDSEAHPHLEFTPELRFLPDDESPSAV